MYVFDERNTLELTGIKPLNVLSIAFRLKKLALATLIEVHTTNTLERINAFRQYTLLKLSSTGEGNGIL